MLARTLLTAFTFALAACATQDNYASLSKELFRNDQGKVVGHRETLRERDTGEIVHRVELYAEVLDASGKVIGYEQRTKSGAIVLDDNGRPIGERLIDLRSKGSNPRSSGVILMY
jgi:hypothetical protein